MVGGCTDNWGQTAGTAGNGSSQSTGSHVRTESNAGIGCMKGLGCNGIESIGNIDAGKTNRNLRNIECSYQGMSNQGKKNRGNLNKFVGC